jgi:threonine/homoserine/homoserine lactone efflux protein
MTGLCVWVIAAALGLAALLRASETGYTVLKLVGGVYLVWLGTQSLLARRMRSPAGDRDRLATPPRRRILGTGYGAGLATNLLNPKIGVFFVTFLPGFVPAGESVAVVSLMLGAIFLVLAVVYFVVLLTVAGRVTVWMNEPRVRRRLDRAAGVVLIGFGLRLATEP